MLLALVLACGFGLPLAAFSTVGAEGEVTGPVAFTVHAALCPIDIVNDPNVGLYDGCHANAIEGVTFTFASLEADPVSFATDASGVGTGMILDGLVNATEVTLSADDATVGYTYCADQNTGTVLFDGARPEGGAIPLFTVDSSQAIVCDWFIYTDEVAAG
jgi:hypothetical protein